MLPGVFMDEREMFDEINALVGAVAKALDISAIEVATAIEQGRMAMEMDSDAHGNFLTVTCDDKTAKIYQGAIFRPGDSAEPDEEDCGGGCSCGH
jgi:hypothetical protein